MRGDRGFSMVWALLVALVVGSLAAVGLERTHAQAVAERADVAALSAFHAAEGGLEEARHALAKDPTWRGGRVRIGACDVEIAVREDAGALVVVSSASPGGAAVTARASPRGDGLPALSGWRRIR